MLYFRSRTICPAVRSLSIVPVTITTAEDQNDNQAMRTDDPCLYENIPRQQHVSKEQQITADTESNKDKPPLPARFSTPKPKPIIPPKLSDKPGPKSNPIDDVAYDNDVAEDPLRDRYSTHSYLSPAGTYEEVCQLDLIQCYDSTINRTIPEPTKRRGFSLGMLCVKKEKHATKGTLKGLPSKLDVKSPPKTPKTNEKLPPDLDRSPNSCSNPPAHASDDKTSERQANRPLPMTPPSSPTSQIRIPVLPSVPTVSPLMSQECISYENESTARLKASNSRPVEESYLIMTPSTSPKKLHKKTVKRLPKTSSTKEPTSSPETPVEASKVVTAPSTPVTEHGAPVTVPQAPTKATNRPVALSNAPVRVPNAPVTAPNACMTAPNAPMTAPNAPVIAPNAPVTAPNAPVTAPNAPVTSPNAPMTASNSSVTAPHVPVTAPTSPISAPNSPNLRSISALYAKPKIKPKPKLNISSLDKQSSSHKPMEEIQPFTEFQKVRDTIKDLYGETNSGQNDLYENFSSLPKPKPLPGLRKDNFPNDIIEDPEDTYKETPSVPLGALKQQLQRKAQS